MFAALEDLLAGVIADTLGTERVAKTRDVDIEIGRALVGQAAVGAASWVGSKGK